MKLNFLDKNKKVVEASPEAQKISDIVYDKTKANIEGNMTFPEKTYVKKALAYANETGVTIATSLKAAMIARVEGKRHFTIRECDVARRGQIDLGNLFIFYTMKNFGSFITETNEPFGLFPFVARARYNKGLEWKKLKREQCNEEMKRKGDERLVDIADMLKILKLPLDEEELEIGIDTDLLKPEYMTWDQFERDVKLCVNLKTIKERHDEMELFGKAI